MGFKIYKKDFVGIFLQNEEDEAVKRAVIALKTDLRKVLDCLIEQPFQIVDKQIFVKTDKEYFGANSHKEEFEVAVRDNALYITGADRRGTIYGIYWFSENVLGVSPWYFWADVPVKTKNYIELDNEFVYRDYPEVEYRGIFINDEEELEHFVQRYMGEDTIGVKTYEKIYELLLRLNLNYLWPAMHVNSFNINRKNGELANQMGIIIGTSHCDMLMRSNNREWKPWLSKKGYENVEYDYSIKEGNNREVLEEYWRESVIQNKDFEVTWTLGMRGIHDSGFEVRSLEGLTGEELLKAKIDLLQEVMDTQEKILREELGEKNIPKNFVPYKEVLELYDNGLKVPEDMTLIWVNDNYGNVRRYPSEEAKKRKGGNGLYYHNSYWAPPGASYLFLNSIPLSKTRNELKKAYKEGIQKLWVTNFGAIKPLEEQLSFYAKVAWEGAGAKTDSETEDEEKWLNNWLCKTFIDIEKIGDVNSLAKALIRFDQLSDVRKVEFYDCDVIPLSSAKNRLKEFSEIEKLAVSFYEKLEEEYKASFFELILMRIQATYFTAGMYYYADLSARAKTDKEAIEATVNSRKHDVARRELLYYYNHVMMAGKWNGILTPEDFPPPRTALYPATSTIASNKRYEDKKINPIVFDASNGKITGDWHLIKNLGWGYGDLLETYGGAGAVSYEFEASGNITLVIHRFPSLNSIGDIDVKLTLDDKEYILEAQSNDEHRGSWKENILNGVDILKIDIQDVSAGRHVLKISTTDNSKYFAFSRISVYKTEDIRSFTNTDLRWPDAEAFMVLADGNTETEVDPYEYSRLLIKNDTLVSLIPSRPELFLPKNFGNDTLVLMDKFIYPEEKDFSFEVIKQQNINEICEYNGEIKFYAGENYTGSTKSENWDYCNGQDLKGNSLALLVRDSSLKFNESDAPRADYEFEAQGGHYELWIKLYAWSDQEMDFEVSVDALKKRISPKIRSEHPWKYSSEHVWKWVPIMDLSLDKGKHKLSFLLFHGGLRVEAFKLIK